MNWLASVIMELYGNAKIMERQKHFLSAISLFVAYRKLRANFNISTLKEEALLMILNMAYVSPSGEEYDYLLQWMTKPTSKYAFSTSFHTYCEITYFC